MIETILTFTLYAALATYAGLISYAVWKVWRGDNGIDRLIGVDLVGTLTIGTLVLMTLIENNNIFIDVALGLALLGFIGIVAFAKYASNERMY